MRSDVNVGIFVYGEVSLSWGCLFISWFNKARKVCRKVHGNILYLLLTSYQMKNEYFDKITKLLEQIHPRLANTYQWPHIHILWKVWGCAQTS